MYLDNPLVAVFGAEFAAKFSQTEIIERQNHEWRQKGGKSKENAARMLTIKGVLPMTPHGAYNLLEETEFCWVIVPFNTDEDEIDEIYAFVTTISQFYHERCSVASLDMAYPGNWHTFGKVVDDYPMLLIREPGGNQNKKEEGFLQKPIQKGHFAVRDKSKWGYKISSEDIESKFRNSLESVIDRTYAKLSEFAKIHSLYQMWYRNAETKTFHEKAISELLNEQLGEIDESESLFRSFIS